MANPDNPENEGMQKDFESLAANLDQHAADVQAHLDNTPSPRPADPDSDEFLNVMDSDFDNLDGEPHGPQEDISFVREDRLVNERVTISEPMYKPLPATAKPLDYIPLPSLEVDEMLDLQEALKNLQVKTAGAGEWANTFINSIDMMQRDRLFSSSLLRDGSDWKQYVEFEGRKLTLGTPQAPKVQGGQQISGDEARLLNSRIMGNYGRVQLPLWNSGVWLSIRSSGTDELHLLEQQLAANQYDLGYLSHGLAYSNTSVHSLLIVIRFILERVVGSNLEDSSVTNLEKSILVPDLFPLIAMYAATIYPSGFPYGRACPKGPITCNHIETEVLRLTKVVLTDNSALKVEHLRHMASQTLGKKKYTAADLVRYRQYFTHYGDRRVWLKPGKIAAVLSPPTIEQYRQSGEHWISEILREANSVLTDASTSEINEFVTSQYMLTTMRQYGHWVKSLEYVVESELESAEPAYVVDRPSIESNLSEQSSDTEIANAFIKEVRKYIEDCALSVVGVTRGKCSKCGTDLVGEGGHPHIIPIDPGQTFFILRGRKIQSTLNAYMAH